LTSVAKVFDISQRSDLEDGLQAVELSLYSFACGGGNIDLNVAIDLRVLTVSITACAMSWSEVLVT
jgi:hypothetical protein